MGAMSKPYYVGSYRDDGLNDPNRGWIVGKFKADSPRKTNDVEIKYWEYPVGPTAHPMKESAIIECTFILKGQTKAIIDNEEIILSAGDYIVIEPGTPNNTVIEILEDAAGLTVKAPSDPSAKKILD
jgi:mannose-6-phosphate isomerase-like protein (cupin superfamily)